MTPHRLDSADALALLLGEWNLERTVPAQATMHGQATFRNVSSRPEAAPRPQSRGPQRALLLGGVERRDLRLPATAPQSALYTEHVRIHTTTGHHLTGTARYTFTRKENNTIDVHLATGALFHTLRFTAQPDGSLLAHATHLCIADRYASTYRILSPAHLTVEHHVHGPAKLHTIRTILTR